jgi:hypothetical protein
MYTSPETPQVPEQQPAKAASKKITPALQAALIVAAAVISAGATWLVARTHPVTPTAEQADTAAKLSYNLSHPKAAAALPATWNSFIYTLKAPDGGGIDQEIYYRTDLITQADLTAQLDANPLLFNKPPTGVLIIQQNLDTVNAGADVYKIEATIKSPSTLRGFTTYVSPTVHGYSWSSDGVRFGDAHVLNSDQYLEFFYADDVATNAGATAIISSYRIK